LEKQSLKQKGLHSSKLCCVLRFTIVLFHFHFVQTIRPPYTRKNDTLKNHRQSENTRKDGFAPPKVIPITAANQPKVYKSRKACHQDRFI
jgi:hypothetical protein